MAKLLGALLIISGLIALIVGTIIDIKFGSNTQITGSFIYNILEQPEINLGFFDYFAGFAFAYAIVCFIVGFVFLIRV